MQCFFCLLFHPTQEGKTENMKGDQKAGKDKCDDRFDLLIVEDALNVQMTCHSVNAYFPWNTVIDNSAHAPLNYQR